MAASLLGSAAPTPPSCRRSSWSPSPSPLMLLPPRTSKPTSLRLDSPWTGLKLLRLQPHRPHPHRNTEKKGPCRGRGVHASLFGVGAPEALVIGVVALLVFGPKGLAEVARNLGKTLRTFQPTIRELQQVSREFKSTLEQEIGLNDVTSSLNSTYKPTSFPNENKQAGVDTNGVPIKPYTSEDLLKVTEEQLAASGAKSQTEASIPEGQPQAAPTTPEVMAATSEIRTSAASTELTVKPEVQTSVAAASETAASTEPTVTAEVQTSAAASETTAQTPSSEKAENERL